MRPPLRTIDLGDMASTLHAQPDVQVLEAVAPEEQDRLESLEPQDIGLDELERGACEVAHRRSRPKTRYPTHPSLMYTPPR